MRRAFVALAVAAAASLAACTEVSTDPDAVAGLQFDGVGYPSIVVGDSLRDSLGLLLPLAATALNNDGDPIPDAEIVYSSPDTVLEMKGGGVVYARRLNPNGTATRVFATVGSLQSQALSLFTVPRPDSLARSVEADTAVGSPTTGATVADDLLFTVLADTSTEQPPVPVQGWIVTFQLRYRDALLSPTDSSIAYSWTGSARRILSFVDTTSSDGRAGRKVRIQSFRAPEDTIFLVATARPRKVGVSPLRSEIRIIVRQGASSSRVP